MDFEQRIKDTEAEIKKVKRLINIDYLLIVGTAVTTGAITALSIELPIKGYFTNAGELGMAMGFLASSGRNLKWMNLRKDLNYLSTIQDRQKILRTQDVHL